MYSRNLDETEDALEFGVSGKLWNGVLVFYDRQSDSLWTQLDGRALLGEHQGARLEHYPSTFTTWARWRAAHPDTLVLEKGSDERGQASSSYAGYFANPDDLFLPELAEGMDGIAPKRTVFGVFSETDAVAVDAAELFEWHVLEAELDGEPIVFLSGEHDDVVAIAAGGRELEPLEGVLVTERLFDRASGEELDVASLAPLRVDRAYWYAWKRSHPDSRFTGE